MKKMNLAEDEQRRALQLFKSATAAAFNAREALQEFRKATTPKLIQILLVHLVAMARADGYLMEKELHAIQWIARELGYKSIAFNHLLKMIYTQDQISLRRNPPKAAPADTYGAHYANSTQNSHTHNSDSSPQAAPSQDQELHQAYTILGVNVGMTEDEIRRAYKKLASQLHPDKLMSQGLTPEQLNSALNEFKRIQAAYSFIKKHRSLYAAN